MSTRGRHEPGNANLPIGRGLLARPKGRQSGNWRSQVGLLSWRLLRRAAFAWSGRIRNISHYNSCKRNAASGPIAAPGVSRSCRPCVGEYRSCRNGGTGEGRPKASIFLTWRPCWLNSNRPSIPQQDAIQGMTSAPFSGRLSHDSEEAVQEFRDRPVIDREPTETTSLGLPPANFPVPFAAQRRKRVFVSVNLADR
jgi:hypothetical protein